MQPIVLDLVADLICPWCLLALRRLAAARSALLRDGLVLEPVWRPFLLYPGTPPAGFDQAAHLRRRFPSAAAADRYHAAVAEAGRAVGIPFRYDRIRRTPSTVDAHRLVLSAPAAVQVTLADAISTAFFTEGADIGRHAVLCRLAELSGIDAAPILAGDSGLIQVRDSDAAAKCAGIASVPAWCAFGRILSVPDPAALAIHLRRVHAVLQGRASAVPGTRHQG